MFKLIPSSFYPTIFIRMTTSRIYFHSFLKERSLESQKTIWCFVPSARRAFENNHVLHSLTLWKRVFQLVFLFLCLVTPTRKIAKPSNLFFILLYFTHKFQQQKLWTSGTHWPRFHYFPSIITRNSSSVIVNHAETMSVTMIWPINSLMINN